MAESCLAIDPSMTMYPAFSMTVPKEGMGLLVVVNDEDGARPHCDVFQNVVAPSRATTRYVEGSV